VSTAAFRLGEVLRYIKLEDSIVFSVIGVSLPLDHVRLWNSLPSKLRQCDSLREFRWLMKVSEQVHTCSGTTALCEILVKSSV